MVRLQHFVIAFVAVTLMASIAMALGAVRGGVRGAVVGGAFGNPRAGAAIGVTREVLDGEGRARANYQSSAEYKNGTYSNFNDAPPDLMVVPSSSSTPVATSGEVILRKDGTALIGVTYPSEWKQKGNDHMVSAVSKDGHAFAVVAILENAKDKQAGINMVKQKLEKNLQNIEFDKTAETKKGAIVMTGKGKGIKSGVNVVFAVGTAELGKAPKVVAAAFVVDAAIEDHYKETIRNICETMRTGEALLKKDK
jgi:hypothetical protein